MDQSGTPAGTNPDRWQPLNLSVAATQNGIILPAGVQSYVGAQWGAVTPFALTKMDASWKDVEPAPKISDPGMNAWIVEVIAKGAEFDPRGPGASGFHGHALSSPAVSARKP